MLRSPSVARIIAAQFLLLVSPVGAQLPSGNWQYHWGDDFSGTQLDTTKWSYNYPWGTTHNHDAVMSPSNVQLGDGRLTLVAERTGSGANFTSGAISSGYSKATFNSGYIEASILLPDTPGSWPAFWGLYSGWPPEADIMEYPIDTAAGSGYSQDQYHTAFHYSTGGGNAAGGGQVNPSGVGDLGGTYHNFGMEWREDDWVGFYFDGQRVSEFGNDSAIAQMQTMYLILNYAVGGWPGTPNTSEWPVGHTDEMKVDFVRVWKSASSKTSNWAYSGASQTVQWDSGGNWTNGSPNLGGITSSFDTIAGIAEQRLDWSGRRTLSVVNLDGDTRYRFGWPDDRLVLAMGNNGSLNPAINVAATSTTEHEVYGALEFAGGLVLSNASNHPLLLTGQVVGGGGSLRVKGDGVVSFDGANSYGADTLIGEGVGPGVARARSSSPFGYGAVVIGESGNQTTARLELENGSHVSNSISFRGRNNDSAAIVNNSGDNTISGVVNIEVGGSTYLVRSDAGTLTLTGDSDPSGVAVRARDAGGTRTLTLGGAAHGVIDGAIENGSATVHLLKTGGGTWSLDAPNTYTGDTTVNEGTLRVSGTTGYGATTVASGAALTGGGTARGNLTAQTGGLVQVGTRGLMVGYNHTVIDDFEGYALGNVRDVASPPWTAHENTSFADIEDDAGNRVLTYGWQTNFRGASRDLPGAVSLGEGQTATYFFRVSAKTDALDHNIGLGDQATTSGVVFSDYEAQLRLKPDANAGAFALDARDGAAFTPTLASGLALNAWYNVWLVVDQTSDTYDLYLNSGAEDAGAANKLNATPLGFRNGSSGLLNKVLALAGSSNIDNAVRIDDLVFLPGEDLTNPLSQSARLIGETLTVDGDFFLQPGATLAIDLAASAHDSVAVAGAALLHGVLEVSIDPVNPPALNDTFTVLTAASVVGSLTLGGADGARFSLHGSSPTSVVLTAVSGLEGDYNNDGQVDAADYTLWRDHHGQPPGTLPNDSQSQPIGPAQYAAWRANYGAVYSAAPVGYSVAPEPGAALLFLVTTVVSTACRRKKSRS